MSKNDVDSILSKQIGQILVNQLNNLKIRKVVDEVIANFDYEIVLDYLEMSGIRWTSHSGDELTSKLPTVDEMKKFLLHELNQIIKDGVAIEKHLQNNFIAFYNGIHLTLVYSIVTITSGENIGKYEADE